MRRGDEKKKRRAQSWSAACEICGIEIPVRCTKQFARRISNVKRRLSIAVANHMHRQHSVSMVWRDLAVIITPQYHGLEDW